VLPPVGNKYLGLQTGNNDKLKLILHRYVSSAYNRVLTIAE